MAHRRNEVVLDRLHVGGHHRDPLGQLLDPLEFRGPLGLVPLPSKWIIEFGEPIPTDEHDDGAADDPSL